MLTIKRDLTNGTLLIGDDIKIFIREIEGNQVTLSIDAPKEITILRGELRWKTLACEPDK